MAFGISRSELLQWKQSIQRGELAFLTHYWFDPRFPSAKTVTKVGCNDLEKLAKWGEQYGLRQEWIDIRQDGYSHFDLLGERQLEILTQEGLTDHIIRFQLIHK